MWGTMFKDYLTYIKITERSGDSPRGRVMGRGSLCCRLPADLSVGSACSPAWIRTLPLSRLPASLARTEIGRPCFTPAHREGCSQDARLLEEGSCGPRGIAGLDWKSRGTDTFCSKGGYCEAKADSGLCKLLTLYFTDVYQETNVAMWCIEAWARLIQLATE